ncbi:sulfur oxidation c-type cytochrome SoxA [Breoghania sp. L-A4]|uniref:sulfur oxidation c-type cytochrome SoxA n=1 Tax=Breoghania sp. L-A4 TaxID=2304600 RepID=UPI000E35D9EE|nr:sulfur oxidation c-type cytochrome SoxA [Breoghania sp. L-A4]AXS40483.1 sulfur oxidation c-type cytochrome SoxA [Breoghania sp. L-A4]
MKWARTYSGKSICAGFAAAALLSSAMAAQAEDAEFPKVGDTVLTTRVAPPEGHPLSEVISGLEYRTSETKDLQLDDFNNPGFLMVDEAEQAWSTVDGAAGKSCESCHGDASESMKGVRAAMPKWNEAAGRPFTLENQINACRTERMEADPWKWESDAMLGMTAYVGLQSRGMPVDIDVSGPMQPWFERGKELYYTRVGQLDMACSNCHEDNYGKYIRADKLSQGQSNGFPTYRFKWQKMGSLHRRFKGCMENIRATAYKRGSDEFVALETYLAWRGTGLSVETPAVRN